MHFRAVDMHVQFEFLADGFDVLEAFLVVRPGAADPDLDVMFDQNGGEFSQGADHAFEGRCYLLMVVS